VSQTKQEWFCRSVAKLCDNFENPTGTNLQEVLGCYVVFHVGEGEIALYQWDGEKMSLVPKQKIVFVPTEE
jgi:hypothetical protein